MTRTPTRMPSRRPGRAGEKGAVLVEAAIVVPLLVAMMIGIFWVGRAYNVYQTMSHAAREGARFAVSPTCASCGNQFPTDDEIRVVVAQSLEAAALDPSLTEPNPISVEWNVTLNPGSTMTERGVSISFSYPMQLVLPFTGIGVTSVTLNTRVQMRRE